MRWPVMPSIAACCRRPGACRWVFGDSDSIPLEKGRIHRSKGNGTLTLKRFLGPPTTYMKKTALSGTSNHPYEKIAEFCWSIGMVWVGLAYGKGVPQLFGKGSLGEIHGRVDSFWFRNVVFVDDNKGWLKQETWAYRHWPRVFHIAIAINCSKYLVVFCKRHDFFGMLLFRRGVGFPINKWMTNPASCGKITMFICVDMF